MTAQPSRPLAITLLALAFLALGTLGWLRCAQALQDWSLLLELGANPGPLYLAAGGALWGLLGFLACLALVTGYRAGPVFSQASALVVVVTYWIDRLITLQNGNPFTNWPFLLILSLAGLGIVFWALSRPASRQFFLDRR